MNDIQRNFLTAGIVCAASGALIGGMAVRERIDERASGLGVGNNADGLVAWRDQKEDALVAPRNPKVSAADERYFYDLMVLLKKEYVDPIPSEIPLATGSVKGMITSLNDEQSLYMSKKLFGPFSRSLAGRFEGIGVKLVLRRMGPESKKPIQSSLDLLERIPVVRVSYVVPNGPAAKAGLQPGDEIERIDGRWVVGPEIAARYRAIDAKVSKKLLPESAKTTIQGELRSKFKDHMMPIRAVERLCAGESGDVKLEWRRKGQVHSALLVKSESEAAFDVANDQGVFRPSLLPGSGAKLKQELARGKVRALDLRGMEHGDLKEMREVLSLLGPAGEYGQVVQDDGSAEPVKISKGTNSANPIRILVDGNTAGVAEALTLALRAKRIGSIEGGATAGEPWIVERTALPDGSGFTLRVGKFRAFGGKA